MLTMRVADYPPQSVLPPHRHEQMSFVVVVRGTYMESMAGVEVEHGPGHMLLRPADETHWQRFGTGGASAVILTPHADTLRSLRECGISLERSRYERGARIAQLARRLRNEAERA